MLNLGWRFDYQVLTPGLRRFVRNAKLPRSRASPSMRR